MQRTLEQDMIHAGWERTESNWVLHLQSGSYISIRDEGGFYCVTETDGDGRECDFYGEFDSLEGARDEAALLVTPSDPAMKPWESMLSREAAEERPYPRNYFFLQLQGYPIPAWVEEALYTGHLIDITGPTEQELTVASETCNTVKMIVRQAGVKAQFRFTFTDDNMEPHAHCNSAIVARAILRALLEQ